MNLHDIPTPRNRIREDRWWTEFLRRPIFEPPLPGPDADPAAVVEEIYAYRRRLDAARVPVTPRTSFTVTREELYALRNHNWGGTRDPLWNPTVIRRDGTMQVAGITVLAG